MKRRNFLQTSLLGGAAMLVPAKSVITKHLINQPSKEGTTMPFTLPNLPYAPDALEPYIDKMTMEIHHGKHHAAYVTNLNKAIENTDLAGKSIEDILSGVSKSPAAVRNNGGGHYNHSMFWTIMKKGGGGQPSGDLLTAINRDFGSFDKFKEQFNTAGATRFGSGWAWLIAQHGKLVVASTPNQDNPLMDVAETKGYPVMGLDVWEHAYYLKYQNRRPDYIAAWWSVVNWDEIANRLKNAR